MNQPFIISLVICTYNNAASLAITLHQLAQQITTNRNAIEIIIVDNNSPDNTQQICADFIRTCPLQAHYIFEGRQGLSHARNTGVDSAQGEYILFTDDDADLPVNWLETYVQQISTSKPDCLYSRINIIWDKAKPWWFLPEYTPCFVGVNYGDQPIVVTDIHREFYGKNFCMKKSLILALGGFDPALGRNGAKLIAGEETLLYRRMVEQKKYLLYFPDAPVGHRLKEREYLAENIKKQFIDGAYSSYHIANIMARKRILGRPLQALVASLTVLAKSTPRCVYYWLIKKRPECFYHQLNILRQLTFIRLWVFAK